jgi:hypothetical protein
VNSHQTTEADVAIARTPDGLEDLLKPVWEKVRGAIALVQALREEKSVLEVQVRELERVGAERLQALERELVALRADLTAREQELKRSKTEYAQLIASGGRQTFSPEEREILKSRIRELIAKINSYL